MEKPGLEPGSLARQRDAPGSPLRGVPCLLRLSIPGGFPLLRANLSTNPQLQALSMFAVRRSRKAHNSVWKRGLVFPPSLPIGHFLTAPIQHTAVTLGANRRHLDKTQTAGIEDAAFQRLLVLPMVGAIIGHDRNDRPGGENPKVSNSGDFRTKHQTNLRSTHESQRRSSSSC